MAALAAVWTLLGGAAALYFSNRARRYLTKREGIERRAFERATTMAFLAVMVGAVVHGVLETVADVSPVSGWTVWDVGIVVACATYVVQMYRAA